MDAAALETVASARRRIQEILSGRDQRLLVVVGPCSVHDVKAAREYAQRLAPIRERLKDQLEVVMRVYFEKPRTTVGWKGLINDPHLDDSYDINTGPAPGPGTAVGSRPGGDACCNGTARSRCSAVHR